MKKLTLEDLLLLGIENVVKKKKKCSYGDLVYDVFKKYPKLFAISDYPQYPDTLKLDRPLRSLRTSGLITGSPITFYSLTNLGKEKVGLLKKEENSTIEIPDKATRSPALNKLREIEKSDDFELFIIGKDNFTPSNMRIRAVLRLTLETPEKILLNQLNFFKRIAVKEKKNQLSDYLDKYIKLISK